MCMVSGRLRVDPADFSPSFSLHHVDVSTMTEILGVRPRGPRKTCEVGVVVLERPSARADIQRVCMVAPVIYACAPAGAH